MTPEEFVEQRETWPKPSQAAGQWIRAKALELAVEYQNAEYLTDTAFFELTEKFRQYIETGQVPTEPTEREN